MQDCEIDHRNQQELIQRQINNVKQERQTSGGVVGTERSSGSEPSPSPDRSGEESRGPEDCGGIDTGGIEAYFSLNSIGVGYF